MKIILFSYFGLKIFSLLEGLDLIAKILWWLGFAYSNISGSLYKGSPPTLSTHQQEKYLVYFISLLPSLVRESLRVVISNRSSEIRSCILLHSGLFCTRCHRWFFSLIGFSRKSWCTLLFLLLLFYF